MRLERDGKKGDEMSGWSRRGMGGRGGVRDEMVCAERERGKRGNNESWKGLKGRET